MAFRFKHEVEILKADGGAISLKIDTIQVVLRTSIFANCTDAINDQVAVLGTIKRHDNMTYKIIRLGAGMKQLRIIIVGCVMWLTSYCAISASSAQDIYAAASPSVVVVVNMDARGRILGTGSGVVVDKNRVITNWHVVESGSTYVVRRSDVNYNAHLISDRRDRDLALLSVEALSAPSIKLGSARDLKVGQAVFAIGAPSGLELTLTNGLVSALREAEDGKIVQTSAPISPGSSGGGLFDDAGKLVGITTLKMAGSAQEGLGFAVPVEWVQDLLIPDRPTHRGFALGNLWIAVILIVALLAFAPRLVKKLADRLGSAEFHSTEKILNTENRDFQNNIEENNKKIDVQSSPKYESIALKEFENGDIDDYLLKKAVSLADGNIELTKTLYLRLRSEQINQLDLAGQAANNPKNFENMKKSKNIINENRGVIVIGCFIAFTAIWTYSLASVFQPPKGSLSYRVQAGLIMGKELAFSNDALMEKAKKYHQDGEFSRAIKILSLLEKDGVSQAEYLLATMYKNGDGLTKDVGRANLLLENSAKKGFVDANLMLGYAYQRGDGFKADLSKSIQYFHAAADLGSSRAFGELSSAYGYGRGVPLNYSEALKWAEKGAAADDALAQNILGLMLYYGYGTPKNAKSGVSWLEKSAQRKYPESLQVLAGIYFSDLEFKDLDKAKKYLEQAASTNDPAALYAMGRAYYEGSFVEKDKTKAIEFYIKSCKFEFPDACWKMGLAYLSGDGLAKDSSEGIKWIRKAADLGSQGAIFDLGYIYFKGFNDIPVNQKEGFRWYLKAAIAGNTDAYIVLGNAYFQGNGVDQDFEEARQWYERSSNAGDAYAQAMLADIYQGGVGTKPDFQKAYYYAEKSNAAGSSRGKYILGVLYLYGKGVTQETDRAIKLLTDAFYVGQLAVADTLSDYYTQKAGPYYTGTSDASLAWAWSYVNSILRGENMTVRLQTLEQTHMKSGELKKAKSIADGIILGYRQKHPAKS